MRRYGEPIRALFFGGPRHGEYHMLPPNTNFWRLPVMVDNTWMRPMESDYATSSPPRLSHVEYKLTKTDCDINGNEVCLFEVRR